jgi:peptidoglycan/LPS O-acetylase OafA/YrhL
MYAVLPLLFAWTLRFPSSRALYAVWSTAVAIAATEYALRSGSRDAAFLLARYFPCFLAGVVAWRLMKIRSPRFSGSAWLLFLIALILIYRLADALRVYSPGVLGALHGMIRNDHRVWLPGYVDLVNDWAFCSAAGLAVPQFLEIRNRRLKSVSKEVTDYSYGIYVSHVPIICLCFRRFRVGSAVVSASLVIFLTAVVSVLAYQLLEDPATRVGKWFAARVIQRTAFA